MILSPFNAILLCIIVVSITLSAILVSHLLEKLKRRQAKIKTLEEKLKNQHSLDPETVSQIFSDLQTRGVSVVRLDSNDIFYRSPRG